MSVSKIQRIWAPCQMFSLSEPCPGASKTLWEIPPPPRAPALITAQECAELLPALSAAEPPNFGLWGMEGFGGAGEGQERGGCRVPELLGYFVTPPPRVALAAVAEQRDMSNLRPTGGGGSKAPGEIQEVSASQTRAAAVQ